MKTASLHLSRRHWLLAAALPALGGLAGCVVAPYGVHYHPSLPPGATGQRAWCSGQAGPVTGLELDLGAGLVLSASAGTPVQQGVPFHAMLKVPAGTVLRFAQAAQLSANGRPLQVPIRAVVRRTVPVDAAGGFEPQQLRPGSGAVDGEAPYGRLALHLEPATSMAPERMEVQGLVLWRDGQALRLPPVTLVRPASPGQPYLYLSTAQIEAQPRGAAAPFHFGDSDAGTLAGIAWKSRWLRVTRATSSTVEGEVGIALQEHGRWRVDASALEARDIDRASVHRLRIVRSTLSFEDSMGAPGIARAPAETRLLLEAMLPRDLPAFTLQMVLERDGQPVAVPPLDFERRNFDGGVQPFNC